MAGSPPDAQTNLESHYQAIHHALSATGGTAVGNSPSEGRGERIKDHQHFERRKYSGCKQAIFALREYSGRRNEVLYRPSRNCHQEARQLDLSSGMAWRSEGLGRLLQELWCRRTK